MTTPLLADTTFAALADEVDDVPARQRPSEIRAADYRQKALDAAHKASSSPLGNVRQLHETAAARWLALAGMEDERGPDAAAVRSRHAKVR